MINSLPPSPKLRFDTETYSLISNIDSSLYRLDGMISLLGPEESLPVLLALMEAYHSLLIDKYIGGEGSFISSVFQDEFATGIINRYLHSSQLGKKLMKDVSKSSHIIKTLHREFFKDNIELNKLAGEYRFDKFTSKDKELNSYPEQVSSLMEDFEKYLASDFSYPVIVNVALIHAQFEMIHPLPFANGLIGRMLIPLHLHWKKMLCQPVLLISPALSNKRLEYFDRLEDITKNNNWDGWIKFFLRAVLKSVNDTVGIIKKIKALEKFEYDKILAGDFASPSLLKLFHFTYSKPIFSVPELTRSLNFTKQTAGIVLAKLTELEIIAETTGQKRNRVFSHKKFIDILGELNSKN